jgi:hypothetical protein
MSPKDRRGTTQNKRANIRSVSVANQKEAYPPEQKKNRLDFDTRSS